MSENDTVDGAADKAAPEEQTEDQIWAAAIAERSASSEDADRDDDTAASDNEDEGTDEKADPPEPSEPADAKPEGEPEPKGEGAETGKADTEKRLKHTIQGQSRKISELQREIAAFAEKKREKGDDIKDLDSLVESYPDLMGPMVNRLKRLEAQLGDQHQQLSKVSQLTREQYDEGLRSEEARLDAEVPDWEKTINDNRKAFDEWINDPDQPRWVYDAYQANRDAVQSAAQTAKLVTAFKSHLGAGTRTEPAPEEPPAKPKPSSTRRLEGARETSSKGTQANLANEGNLSEDEIWNRAVKAREKKRAQQMNPHRI